MQDINFLYTQYETPNEKPHFSWLDAQLHGLLGLIKRKRFSVTKLHQNALRIYHLSLEKQTLNQQAFSDLVSQSIQQSRLNKSISNDAVYETLSVICEAASRALGMRPYVVQIMGALAQYHQFAIQMLPGEGKTVTAAISAVLAGWTGKPCHVITSNDYLAGRDSLEMAPLYHLCQLSVGAIASDMGQDERRTTYRKQVVYATSGNLLADFLRDQLLDVHTNEFDHYLLEQILPGDRPTEKVMAGLHTAIVDEVDSVLADEAAVPLIISRSVEDELFKEAILTADKFSAQFQVDLDYTADDKQKDVQFTGKGLDKIAQYKTAFPAKWRSTKRVIFLLSQSIKARLYFLQGKEYVLLDDKVIIVDSKTGRLVHGRTWSLGLQQAVEAKEGVALSNPTETHIRMSFQRFFRFYKHLSGMSGTLQNLEKELWTIYQLLTIKIPKRVNNTYSWMPIKLCSTQTDKTAFILENIKTMREQGRPVLVGTDSVTECLMLASALQQQGIFVDTLNALTVAQEDEVIQQAGDKGKVTIATNIAGRGTDIKLTDAALTAGGLHVIATRLFESKRIDLQLYGRCSRQGQPGSVQLVISLDDELLKHIPDVFMTFLKRYLRNKAIESLCFLLYLAIQRRVENKAFQIRKKMLAKDFSTKKILSFTR